MYQLLSQCCCISVALFYHNRLLLLQVVGCTLVGVGLWLALDPQANEKLDVASSAGLDDSLFAIAVYIMFAVGIVIFAVGCLGWSGAKTRKKKALTAVRSLEHINSGGSRR